MWSPVTIEFEYGYPIQNYYLAAESKCQVGKRPVCHGDQVLPAIFAPVRMARTVWAQLQIFRDWTEALNCLNEELRLSIISSNSDAGLNRLHFFRRDVRGVPHAREQRVSPFELLAIFDCESTWDGGRLNNPIVLVSQYIHNLR